MRIEITLKNPPFTNFHLAKVIDFFGMRKRLYAYHIRTNIWQKVGSMESVQVGSNLHIHLCKELTNALINHSSFKS